MHGQQHVMQQRSAGVQQAQKLADHGALPGGWLRLLAVLLNFSFPVEPSSQQTGGGQQPQAKLFL